MELDQDTIKHIVYELKTIRLSSRDGILVVTGTKDKVNLDTVPEHLHNQIITGINALKFMAGTRKKMTMPEALRSWMYDPVITLRPSVKLVDEETGEWEPSLYIDDESTGETIEISGPLPLMKAIEHSRDGLETFIKRTHKSYINTAVKKTD